MELRGRYERAWVARTLLARQMGKYRQLFEESSVTFNLINISEITCTVLIYWAINLDKLVYY